MRSVISLVLLALVSLFFVMSQVNPASIPTDATTWFAFVGNLTLLAIALQLAGNLSDGFWSGYIFLGAMGAWVTLGYGAALLLVVLATMLVCVVDGLRLHHQQLSWWQQATEGIARLSLTGWSIAIAQGVLSLTGHSVPASAAELRNLPSMAPAIFAAYVGVQALGIWLTQVPARERIRYTLTQLPVEGLIAAAAVVLPLVLYEIGPLAFLILIGAAISQVVRYYEVNRTRQSLLRRISELSGLVHLGQAINKNLSIGGVTENTYLQVREMLACDLFFIALRQQDEMPTYTLVMENGQPRRWQRHAVGDMLIERVLRSAQPILINETPSDWRWHDLETTSLESALAVPLTNGQDNIGVLAVLCETPDAYDETDLALLRSVAYQASLAIRNARLYDRTSGMVQSLSLINQSLQDVIFNLSHEDALRTASQLALHVTQADRAAVLLSAAPQSKALRVVESIGFDELLLNGLEAAYQARNVEVGPRVVNDIGALSALPGDDVLVQQARRTGFAATLDVPLRSGKSVGGYLAVYHHTPHPYDATEINLMEMIANQITAALNNAELLQALELYAAEQAQLVHLSRISSSNLDLARVIGDVCEILQQMLALWRVEIGLVVMDQDALQLYRREDELQAFQPVQMPIQQIPEVAALQSRSDFSPLRICYPETPNLSPELRAYMHDVGCQTFGFMPMRIQGEMTGLILLYDDQHRTFTSNEHRLLEMANNQVAPQIYNARVHTLTEEALMQRLEQLALIEEIAQKVSESLDLNLIIASVLDAAIQATQADIASLALIDENRQQFQVITQEVINGQVSGHTIVSPLAAGVIGQVVRAGEMLMLSNNINDPNYVPPTMGVFASSLAIPLRKGEKVIGVLNLESQQPNFFTNEHVGFIKSLAGHAAISIDNAQLLDERQHEITTLQYLRDLTLQVSRVSSIETVIQAVLRTSIWVLHGNHSALYFYDAGTHEIVTHVSLHRTQQGTWQETELCIPHTFVYHVASTNQAHAINNVVGHKFYAECDAEAVEHRSIIGLPINRRGVVRQVLCITFESTKHFTERDLNAADLLAGQVAGHIENADLNDELRRNNDQMRAILDATRDGIILLDRAGRVQDANRAACEILGLELEQLMRQSFSRVMAQVEQYTLDGTQADAQAKERMGIVRHQEQEYYILRHHEERRYIEESSTDVRDDEGHLIGELRSLRDVTERRQLDAYRKEIQRFVVHDLRAPLSSIISSTYMMSELLSDFATDDNLDALVHNVQRNAERLLRMVDTMQRQPDDGRARLIIDPNPVSLRELTARAYDVLAASIDTANLRFETDIAPEHDSVLADIDIIGRVLTNLLNNAIKFTPSGGRILVRTDASADAAHMVRVMVCDTGQGIPQEMRERVFNLSEQVEGNRVIHGLKGFGMGLAFCKIAVETHGGRIWVADDGPLSGACFAFTLPRATAPQTEASADPVEAH